MSKIVITAESGSDITLAQARDLGIEIVPMHVTIGDRTIDDGTISAAEMLERCRQQVVLPKTSGCTPADFELVFDRIHENDPDAQILHLAYSAVTTCSMESAIAAAEGRDYVTMIDTKFVTIGQGLIVTRTAEWVAAHPEATVEEARDFAADLAARTRLAFIPGDLGYLRAGGRLSNVAFVGAILLRIKPVIELVDGKLVATKKLRGNMGAACLKLMDTMVLRESFDPSQVFFVRSPGLPVDVQEDLERHARELGFEQITWYETGNVITSHCGPGSFGLAFVAAQ